MTRLRLLPLVLGLLVASACNKPSEENCRKALANMQLLLGTEHVSSDELIEGEVRRCKGGSSRGAVDCAIKATSVAQLNECGFMKLSAGATAPAEGSAAAPTGSAAAAPAADPTAAPTAGSAAGPTADSPAAPTADSPAAPTADSPAAPTADPAAPAPGSAAN